jgi:CheY-like chemotaxis protein
MNLAVNARDAMPSGGVIRFSLDIFELCAGEMPPIPELLPGRWVRIEVTDTGKGIPPEVIPHIFEPFFTTKPVGQGTGLGLAQVYGIIKGHGGFIEVYSQPGDGTIFSIYLPALDAPEIEAPGRDTLADQSIGSGQAILLVEDDQAARDALQILLQQQNYLALTASNGLEALQVLGQTTQPVDLVISDIVMPEMDGVELYRVLHSQQPELKVLFITGHPLDETSQSLLQGGQVHWMQKPFSASSFNHMVKGLLEESHLQV